MVCKTIFFDLSVTDNHFPLPPEDVSILFAAVSVFRGCVKMW